MAYTAGALERSSPDGLIDMAPRRHSRFRQIAWTHLNEVKGSLAVGAVCTLGVSATGLLKPWPLKIVLDNVIGDDPLPASLGFLQGFLAQGTMTVLVALAAIMVLIAAGEALFEYFQIFISSAVGYRVLYALRRDLFSHLQRLSLSFHTRAKSGDLLSRIVADTNDLKNIFSEDILQFCSHILMVIGMLVILIFLNWKIALIAVATVPFLGYTLFHLFARTRASSKKQKKHEGLVASRMSEVLMSISLVQAYARERYEEKQFDAATARTLRESIRVARLKAAAKRSSAIITEMGAATAVLLGAVHVIRGGMTVGDLVVALAYLGNMYKPMKGLAKISSDISKAMGSADRLAEVLDVEPEIQDHPNAIRAPRLKGEIVFRGVSFDYGDGRKVLQDVSFVVPAGQRLVLVGASGAGKSTIVSLILRLYEFQEGNILIDDVDIRRFRRESLRRQIGLVLQDSILFGATVRQNIAYGRPEAHEDEIVAAAQAANAHEFICELEDGYDAIIGERGATLSGGQQQRIAIARALVRNAPILILDEPMRGLDVESEAKVREALARLMAGKTCLTITHDLQAVTHADQVVLLENGRITERGTHAELIAHSRRYRHLYELDRGAPALKVHV
jgi:ABC-type multidrug transport system fused ATPase/permease subunit